VAGKDHSTQAAGGKSPGKMLTITVNMDVGNLTLITS